jgi:hypothetical protein
MLQPQYYNLIDALVYFIAATIPIYFILKLRNTNHSSTKHLTHIIILLLSFILIQGIYHVAGVVGFGLLAKGILEPLSIIALLSFAGIYLLYASTKRKMTELRT